MCSSVCPAISRAWVRALCNVHSSPWWPRVTGAETSSTLVGGKRRAAARAPHILTTTGHHPSIQGLHGRRGGVDAVVNLVADALLPGCSWRID